jgi:hypothetical protein
MNPEKILVDRLIAIMKDKAQAADLRLDIARDVLKLAAGKGS